MAEWVISLFGLVFCWDQTHTKQLKFGLSPDSGVEINQSQQCTSLLTR